MGEEILTDIEIIDYSKDKNDGRVLIQIDFKKEGDKFYLGRAFIEWKDLKQMLMNKGIISEWS